MEEESNKDEEFILESVRNMNESLRKKNKSKRKKINKLEGKIERKNKKIEYLKQKIERIRDDEGPEGSTHGTYQNREGRGEVHSQEESTSRSTRPKQPIKDELTTEVGQVFVEWCNSAGATMVDRHTMFADKVTERLPGAEVARVFREKNAAGVFFVEDAQDAVEYWVVRVRGRDLLLPQPDRSGFREVEQCFEGRNVAPEEIEEIYPGELQPKEGKRVLKAKGLIS